MTDDDWRDDALCRQVDPELFFPESGKSAGPAKRICNGDPGRDIPPCPVRDACLAYALTEHMTGVWGGLSERERGRIRRERGIRKALPPINHGTVSGYRTHYRRSEPPCDDCRRAQAEYAAAKHSGPKPCGTEAAYARHRRNGEPPCEACRRAQNKARRTRGWAA